jgi:alkylation response protein AidB-like acyl-CoA dehydrogenase
MEDMRRLTVYATSRLELAEWERAQPANFYTSDRNLQLLLEFYWGADKLRAHAPGLSRFGGEAATIVDQAVRRANFQENLPRLERYSTIGDRTEDVTHSSDHHLAGSYIYGSRAMSVYAEPGSNLLALALFYISSYNGEAGHNCPLACTAGVIKTLQQVGSAELRDKYLPRLLDPDYTTRFHGAQFLTEIQGGSDVGANACVAAPLDGSRGTWVLNGEKWFCSNVTADLALVTAKPVGSPEGTKGIGLFLVPRRLDDGSSNGVYIRRLKDKLGTRSLATAEIDLRDAVAFQIGVLERGFQQAMDFVINTSRLYNAVGSAAAARRAYVIAWTYAQHRRAFGAPIGQYPLVRESLAEMRSETMAMTSGSFYLAHLRDLLETGRANETLATFFRFAVNLNKYRTSVSGTDVVRRGIELLGGNGAMENFSVLPRLLRDSVIFEAWEGAHNTLIVQSVRDIRRYRLHEVFFAHVAEMFSNLRDGSWREYGNVECDALRGEVDALSTEEEQGSSVFLRRLADRMMYLFYAACMAREAEWEEANKRATSKRAVVEFLWQHRISRAKENRSEYLAQIAKVSSEL